LIKDRLSRLEFKPRQCHCVLVRTVHCDCQHGSLGALRPCSSRPHSLGTFGDASVTAWPLSRGRSRG
jgi:hypothetical protein